jgi:hypothetical protein
MALGQSPPNPEPRHITFHTQLQNLKWMKGRILIDFRITAGIVRNGKPLPPALLYGKADENLLLPMLGLTGQFHPSGYSATLSDFLVLNDLKVQVV